MKTLTSVVLFCVCLVSFCSGQDKVVTITPAGFDKVSQRIYLSQIDAWLFKQGTDTSWAKKDIDVAGWRKLNLADLSEKYADKNGKLECWLRLKIKLNTGFKSQQFGISCFSWAAVDVYIDGKPAASFGNTGQNSGSFAEDKPFGRLPTPVILTPGRQYTIALHFVDYISPLTPRRLKSNDLDTRDILALTNADYNSYVLNYTKKNTTFNTIWIAVCAILTFLFWLLAIQNPIEKNLRLIAICSSAFTLAEYCTIKVNSSDTTYFSYSLLKLGGNIFIGLILIIIPLIVAKIFNRKIAKALKIFLGSVFVFITISAYTPIAPGPVVVAAIVLALFSLCIYYLASSWKQLRGAQWAIVVGLFSSLLAILSFVIFSIYSNAAANPDLYFIISTVFMLSFPLSLLVYVAMRFKEIIAEVRHNAQQVVALSEEKKEAALNRQKVLEEEVSKQTAEIRTTLDHLKATQTQLIQSEKMASLGELTAGIAHEIQNPLNFVNNFSEVSVELLTELKEETEAGNKEEVIALADDLTQNLQKINHHGKRADSIVKGMLEHSRVGTGEKQPTDINALADEFLKLSYHGMRAKDKSFNAELITHFDGNLPKVNVAQQDIGRVLLNLFNNAFYTVNEKKKTAESTYKPEVKVYTSAEKNNIIIKVKDNGNGISDAIKDKIMQPFFTTKPTGEGTGLGLSLSYDIAVKGHGGSIQVNSNEGEGSEFIITLPLER